HHRQDAAAGHPLDRLRQDDRDEEEMAHAVRGEHVGDLVTGLHCTYLLSSGCFSVSGPAAARTSAPVPLMFVPNGCGLLSPFTRISRVVGRPRSAAYVRKTDFPSG